MWAVVAFPVFDATPICRHRDGWFRGRPGYLGVVLAGLALACGRDRPVLRTIGVALLVVALSGGSVLLLAVWGRCSSW